MTVATQFFAAGKTIFKEGDASGKVYLVKSGRVQLLKGADNEKVILEHIEPNGIFGEMGLIDNKPRSASAIAIENTYCTIIDKDGFEERLNSIDPFMRGVFRILVNRLRDTTAQFTASKLIAQEEKK